MGKLGRELGRGGACHSEESSLLHRTHVRKLCVVVCTCNPVTGEAETGGSVGLVTSQSSLIAEP